MRATPPPVALPLAAAALPLVAAALVPLAVPSTALAERWLRPVPGEVARSFDYTPAAPFARGAHRGADLAARPGTAVRAACGGRVVHAGPVAGRDVVVSVRCRARRVSYLPLRAVTVRAGATVRPGAPLGTVAPGHGGLHLGVRREGDPFAYEDPMSLLPAPGSPGRPLAAPRPSSPRRRGMPRRWSRPRLALPRWSRPRLALPRWSRPRLALPRWSPPRQAVPPRRIALPRPRAERRLAPARPALGRPARRVVPLPSRPVVVRPTGRDVAPWPVWVGLAMLLCGATGSGALVLRHRRRRAARRLVPSRA